jgi:hypothetical protein
MAQRDFFPAHVACISSKIERKGGDQQGRAVTGLLTKKCKIGRQNIIFEVMSEVQKDLEDGSAGIDHCKKKIYKDFVRKLKSKLASTLTSPVQLGLMAGFHIFCYDYLCIEENPSSHTRRLGGLKHVVLIRPANPSLI